MRDRTRGAHLRPVLQPSAFAAWWWLILAAAIAMLVATVHAGLLRDVLDAGITYWVLLGFVVLGELRPVVTSGRTDPNGVNLASAFIFAVLLSWGLELAVVGVVLSATLGELVRRKRAFALLFNVSQYLVSYTAAWSVLLLLGWQASAAQPAQLNPAGLLPILLAAVTYHLVNISIVGIAIGLVERRPLVASIFADFAYYSSTTGAVLALSPLVVIVLAHHWGFLPLLLLPLYLLYQTAAMSLEREQRALRDDLTGLGNRALLGERLEEHVAEGRPVAVCLLDLDRFKEVNDTLGHSTGDEVLRRVSARLLAGVRPEDTVARLGGDEFVLLLDVADTDEALRIVERVVEHLQEPYEIDGARLEVDASAGIAFSPEQGVELEVLLRRADAAMYAAKEAASPTVVFTEDLEHRAPSRLQLLADLRRGVRAGELELHYQPQVSVEHGHTQRLEALVRWRHPVEGLLLPDRFLPLVERTAVMRALTNEVLELALAQLARWRAAGLRVPVAVNVSLYDLSDRGFAQRVVDGLQRHDVPPSQLSLEITEEALVGDPTRAQATLVDLQAAGIELALDDFGTGHASLTRLKRVPVTEVKIDRVFVQGCESDPEQRAIVRAVIELGHGLGMRCVAEGVESAEILATLRDLGCDVAQGFHIARPMRAELVEPWLRDQRAAAGGDGRSTGSGTLAGVGLPAHER